MLLQEGKNREILTGKRKQQTEGRKPPYIKKNSSNYGYKIWGDDNNSTELHLSFYFGVQ